MTVLASFPGLGTIAIEEHQHDSIMSMKPLFLELGMSNLPRYLSKNLNMSISFHSGALHACLQNVNFAPLPCKYLQMLDVRVFLTVCRFYFVAVVFVAFELDC